ncbi:hypothetical protein GOP47_0011644 [Adiantum capillus-veneris]|uniref:Uncharacterized protein n=1 Tax=Adiantum capillus-veneris TaxID=13818 RepID=A0A9D4ZI17_ADICA|nr:hypothetical protein GOP47_0011644 [Adiantum capillus-veneris]
MMPRTPPNNHLWSFKVQGHPLCLRISKQEQVGMCRCRYTSLGYFFHGIADKKVCLIMGRAQNLWVVVSNCGAKAFALKFFILDCINRVQGNYHELFSVHIKIL